MNRRKLLSTVAPAALAVSGVAAAAPVPVNPDAALLAICAEYEALDCEVVAANHDATIETEGAIKVAMRGREDRMDAIVQTILAAPPRTPAGFAAVVKLLMLWDYQLLERDPELDTIERLRLALFLGILGRTGA